MAYDLWYWTGIQGRGEFVRLPMEAAGIEYTDCARVHGDDTMMKDMAARAGRGPFAPPYLVAGDMCIAQVAHILAWLGDRHDLAPKDEATVMWLIQLQLTIADIVTEVHNVHHPVEMGAYYDDQKPEAARAAAQFRDQRIPKFLKHFEAAAGVVAGDWVAGDRWSYVDTSLFQLVEGLRYMFPKRMAAIAGDYPNLIGIHDRVAELPGIESYLKSDRRLAFNTDGIFRHYPELDGA